MPLTLQSCTWEGIQIQSDVAIAEEDLTSYTGKVIRALKALKVLGTPPFSQDIYNLTDVDRIEVIDGEVTAFLKPGARAKEVTPLFPPPPVPFDPPEDGGPPDIG